MGFCASWDSLASTRVERWDSSPCQSDSQQILAQWDLVSLSCYGLARLDPFRTANSFTNSAYGVKVRTGRRTRGQLHERSSSVPMEAVSMRQFSLLYSRPNRRFKEIVNQRNGHFEEMTFPGNGCSRK
nr:hypothetical protein CFP56_34787 [Quercus suber]